MEKYSRGNIFNFCDTITNKMGIEGFSACKIKGQKESGCCPQQFGQCPTDRIDWVTRYLAAEEMFIRGKSPTDAAEIISHNRTLVTEILAKVGCTLLDKILERRAEVVRQQPLQDPLPKTHPAFARY